MISEITYADTGSAFMLSSDGTIIAHQDITKVEQMENNIDMLASDSSLSQLVSLEDKMIAGESGVANMRMRVLQNL